MNVRLDDSWQHKNGTGTIYPAELAVAPNGKFLYVAEDVGDRLAAR